MLITPGVGDQGDPANHGGRVGAESAAERRVIRDGIQLISSGSLICRSCELPLELAAPQSATLPIRCGFCGHTARAWELIRPGVGDTDRNAVSLVARLAA